MEQQTRVDLLLECGHEFEASKLDNPQRAHRSKVECPGGCGWQKYEVVRVPVHAEQEPT